jgi:hypothetical protein
LRDAVAAQRRELDTQFKRLAQMQAEIDQMKKAWGRSTIVP